MAAAEQRVIQIDVDGSKGEISARKLESALATIDRRLDPLGVATKRYTQDVAALNAAQAAGLRTTDQTAQRIAQLNRAMDATRARLTGATVATGQLQTAMGAVQTGMGLAARAAGVLGVGLSVGALVAYGKHVVEVVGGLGEMAEQMGISVTALQAYQFAAVQGGIKTEQLETAITKFGRKIGDAAGGNKEAIESFKKLGVQLLDFQGKLRPTEDILAETARKITAMEDPAKRTAAEMNLFGRAGAKLETILKELGGGTDEMARKAKEAGALISETTVKTLDDMGDKAEVAQLKFRALSAELIAGIGTGAIDVVSAAIDRMTERIVAAKSSWGALLRLTTPTGIAEYLLTGAVDIGMAIGGVKPKPAAPPPSIDQQIAAHEAAIAAYPAGSTSAAIEARRAEVARLVAERGRLPGSPGASPKGVYGPAYSTGGTTGALDPAVTGAGDATQKRIDKLEREAELELKWAKDIYEASKIGAEAVNDMTLKFEAAKKASAAFGEEADKNKAGVDKLADSLYKSAKALNVAKEGAKFNLQTDEIERGNKLLEAEIKLLEAAPEVRAKEIALIKVKNDLQKAGLTDQDVEYQRRIQAVEVQEQLNKKLEEGKKQQEAMAEPFKNAIQSLQSYIVEGLTGGFTNARQAILGIWKRMMAELAVATVIRPIIMQPLVSLLGAGGLVPQSVVSQYGGGPLGGLLGGGGIGGAGGGTTGSIFGGGMPGGGLGGGDMFGIGGFMSRPIFGGTNGLFGADPLAGMFGGPAGGVGSIGGVLGGLGGIGAGIFGLASGNMAGGISGLLGGGLGLAGGLGLLGSWAGPAGMAISLIGGLLGGLLKKKPKTPQEVANISFGPGGDISSMLGMTRGKAPGDTLKISSAFGTAFSDLLGAYNLSTQAGFTGGYIGHSIGKNTGSQYFIGTGQYGGARGTGFGAVELAAGISSPEEAVNMLAAALFKRGVSEGTISGLTSTQRTAVGTADLKSIDEIKAALDFSKVYDKIARGTENITAAEQAIEALNEQFRGVKASAKQYGLDVGIIAQREREAINKLATDMNADYRRRTLGMTPEGQLQVTLEDFDKERADAIKNAQFLNQTVTGALVDINAIEAYYAKQRVAIIDAANAQANDGLEQLWRRLTYGDLSAASPLGTLEGTRSAYQVALAGAQGGDLTARGNLAGFAEDYVRSGYQYQGSNAAQAALVSQVAADIAPLFTANSNFTVATDLFMQGVVSWNRTAAEQQLTITRLIASNEAQAAQIASLILRLDRAA